MNENELRQLAALIAEAQEHIAPAGRMVGITERDLGQRLGRARKQINAHIGRLIRVKINKETA